MKVLIFGGTGFFGIELVKAHLKAGNSVTIVSRGNKRLDSALKVDYLVADRLDLASLEKALAGKSWDLAYD